MGGYTSNENLNDTPIVRKGPTWGKRVTRKAWSNTHQRGELKIIGQETDIHVCKECHNSFPLTSFNTGSLRQDGAYYLQAKCRQCATVIRKEQREVLKIAPPKPERCDCCHKKDPKLHGDHVHGTLIFKGWTCTSCNTGTGKLGDDLRGILQAAIYLENDIDKIIATLREVAREVFARRKE